MRLACGVLFVFLSLHWGFDQNPRKDSLVKVLDNTPSDTSRIKLLHQLAEATPENQSDSAVAYEEQALALAKKLNNTNQVVEAYTHIGSIYRRHSNYYKAISFYHQAIHAAPDSSFAELSNTYLELGIAYLRTAKLDSSRLSLMRGMKLSMASGDLRTEASVYNMLGNVLKEENNYKEALEYYLKATAIFEREKDNDGLTQSISNVGNIEFLLGDSDKALDYALQSLKIAEAIDKKSSIAYANRLLGRIYRKQKKFDEAIKVYRNALKGYEELGATRDIGETHINTGNIYFETENYNEALSHYFRALEIERTIRDSANIPYSFTAIGMSLSAMKQYKRAETYLDSARLSATQMRIPNLVMDVYGILSENYADQKNYKVALDYRLKFMSLKDSLDELRNREVTAELEAKYQNQKNENEIRSLNAQNEISALQLAQRSRERIYLIGVAVLSLLLVALLYNRYRTKLKTAKKLQELDAAKSRFFANISHEFRTPLSLIMGPLKRRIAAGEAGEKPELQMMHRNAERLHNLINQLLDLSRIESGSMKLQVAEGDLARLLSFIFSSFTSLAEQKRIAYAHETNDDMATGFFDRDKLEKILYNLLSNAFKFTPDGGRIKMESVIEGSQLTVRVKDSGIGIASDKLERVFDRFYQVDDSATRSGEGTGIGLALSKEMADLHHGKLTVSSVVGEGTTFSLTIPINKESYQAVEIVQGDEEQEGAFYLPAWVDQGITSSAGGGPTAIGLPIVLVAEDNEDMRTFIADVLRDQYHVIGVADGIEAFERSLEVVPDLVISDLMMPQMDGNTLCAKLRAHETTSHIPVIILTARADRESKIGGLQTGADDYLTKPFDADELLVRVDNLIEQRRLLRKRFGQEISLSPKDVTITTPDAAFLSRLIAIVEARHSDPDFGVEQLVPEIAMSRMQLHRKLKALTDKSAGEFIRQFRLERAKQLLSIKGMQVSEVAYQVGFNNLSNFSKIFKEFTGMSPSEFGP